MRIIRFHYTDINVYSIGLKVHTSKYNSELFEEIIAKYSSFRWENMGHKIWFYFTDVEDETHFMLLFGGMLDPEDNIVINGKSPLL